MKMGSHRWPKLGHMARNGPHPTCARQLARDKRPGRNAKTSANAGHSHAAQQRKECEGTSSYTKFLKHQKSSDTGFSACSNYVRILDECSHCRKRRHDRSALNMES